VKMAGIRRYVVSYRAYTGSMKDPEGGPYWVDAWSEDREIELEAYDASEARQRLEYRLVREGSVKTGCPQHAVYQLIDIAPYKRVPS
jgi:hypothetical protein